MFDSLYFNLGNTIENLLEMLQVERTTRENKRYMHRRRDCEEGIQREIKREGRKRLNIYKYIHTYISSDWRLF